MANPLARRHFLQTLAVGAAAVSLAPKFTFGAETASAQPYKISLAEWSLHKALRDPSMKLTNLDFPRVTREEFGIEAVEYVNQFFKDKARDESYLSDLNKRCADHGVKSVLIMVDGEGNLGDADEAKRKQAVEQHHQWVDAAKFLGCHSIRVNAASSGSYTEQIKLASDGLRQLSEYAAPHGIGVVVENHGGFSSNGAWLAALMDLVNHPGVGTLPDFGNYGDHRQGIVYDPYLGTAQSMPYAKGVSGKTFHFGTDGEENTMDFRRLMQIVKDSGFRGTIDVEYEGKEIAPDEGIRLTRDLLIRLGGRL